MGARRHSLQSEQRQHNRIDGAEVRSTGSTVEVRRPLLGIHDLTESVDPCSCVSTPVLRWTR